MPVRLLIALLVVVSVGLLGYAFWYDHSDLAVAAIPAVVLLAAAVTFKPQLDWWYYRSFPSDLEPPVVRQFATGLPAWYSGLPKAEQRAFRQSLFLVRMGLDFKPQGSEEEDVPVDLAALLAVPPARLLHGSHRYTLEPFEHVVLYKHPFPSPTHPKDWHNSELYVADGVILLNLERAIPGIRQPQEHFDIAQYEWIRAAKHAGVPFPPLDGIADWRSLLPSLSPHDENWVLEAIGLPAAEVDDDAVLRTLAMSFVASPSHVSA